ncbi:hypothetical protein RFI_26650 [Reticulomyxa filosa]|uniref:Uncharacterized protein n=1 Tax=Reticulomyxa filosa TaxID=46433 RepID=X6MB75_RETFI|nr:hypothetical protein RFI_26650 [Reticulomyxa filosa]|eukprot:ETO10727.1 hypothetical protein RFI_26650 [Reticulomyxa filosa]
MKLKEGQLYGVFKCLIDRLSNEKEDDDIRIKCAELIGELLMKLNETQLIDAFDPLIDMVNDIDCIYSAFNTVREQLQLYCGDNAYNLLKGIAQRLDEKQMNIALNYFMDKINDKNEHQTIRIKCIQLIKYGKECAELLGTIAVNLNGKSFDDAFKCLTNELTDSHSSVRESVFTCLINELKGNNEKNLYYMQNLLEIFQ